jgi:hypothetical protein
VSIVPTPEPPGVNTYDGVIKFFMFYPNIYAYAIASSVLAYTPNGTA